MADDRPYFLLGRIEGFDYAAVEFSLDSHSWMLPTAIDDEDLTFGGKPLSAWHEEERRRLSCGSHDSNHDAPQPSSSSPSDPDALVPSSNSSPPLSASPSSVSSCDEEEEHRGRQRVRQICQVAPSKSGKGHKIQATTTPEQEQ